MRKSSEELLNKLQLKADSERLCIVPSNDVERRLLCRHKQNGSAISPWRGMFALESSWSQIKPDERTRRIVRTLGLKHPTWVFRSLTAALMHGMEVAYLDLMPIHIVQDPQLRSRSTGQLARDPVPVLKREDPIVVADGVAITSLERTVLDCLIDLDFRLGLAIADSALRVSGKGSKHFIDYAKKRAEIPGRELALDALSWADARAANGGESVARAVMIEQGFMVPDLQVEIPNVIERGKYFGDFFWQLSDGRCVVGELDGLDKYCDPVMTGGRSIAQVMSDERRRESRIGANGYPIVRFSYDEALNTETFVKLLDAYGIPRGRMRPRGR